jgi:hypothetical protein
MAPARVERRLAAILAADVAGYSRLMGIDEEGTLAALKACRGDLIDPRIAEHRGRIVKTTGDGALVEFASVVEATRCAMAIQDAMAERNTAIPEDHRIELRIGINIGDVIIDEGDVYGDGVNIAARLEPLAEPGAICLSESAYASMDLFVVPTVTFKLLYGLLILKHGRREIIYLSATAHPSAEWISRQLTEAYGWEAGPCYLIHDRDSAYGEVFTRRLWVMGIRDRPTAPRSPWQNDYCERLIGSIRRECLDHMLVFGEQHLRRLLRAYAEYYNRDRTHLSLDKDSPASRAIESFGRICPVPILGGLHHRYVRI